MVGNCTVSMTASTASEWAMWARDEVVSLAEIISPSVTGLARRAPWLGLWSWRGLNRWNDPDVAA
jgi:hypothetical protein